MDIESHRDHVRTTISTEMPRATDFYKQRQVDILSDESQICWISNVIGRLPITEALANFPTPTNRTDLQSFFGLVNQLSSSTDTVAQLLLPLRPLLSTKHKFVWFAEHDQAFARVRCVTT